MTAGSKMPATQTTKRLVAVCPDSCSLNPEKIGGAITEALLAARANGAGQPALMKRASELLGRPVPHGNMQRHMAHMRELAEDEPADLGDGKRPTDLAILDAIIIAGHKNSRAWKPTIKDTLDAMKLKIQMTGQSAFEDMLTAMDAALDAAEDEEEDDGEVEAENPDAVASEDERAQAGDG